MNLRSVASHDGCSAVPVRLLSCHFSSSALRLFPFSLPPLLPSPKSAMYLCTSWHSETRVPALRLRSVSFPCPRWQHLAGTISPGLFRRPSLPVSLPPFCLAVVTTSIRGKPSGRYSDGSMLTNCPSVPPELLCVISYPWFFVGGTIHFNLDSYSSLLSSI